MSTLEQITEAPLIVDTTLPAPYLARPPRPRRRHRRPLAHRVHRRTPRPHRRDRLKQLKGPASPEIHFKTTGPETRTDTDGQIDILVSGIGTGGTITGINRFIKQTQKKAVRSVAVGAIHSRVLIAIRNGEEPKPDPHKIQGIGAGFKPDILDLDLVDEIATVSSDESLECAHRLHSEEGLTCGISSGAAVAVACQVAARPQSTGKLIVTVLPDAGERYLSTGLFKTMNPSRTR